MVTSRRRHVLRWTLGGALFGAVFLAIGLFVVAGPDPLTSEAEGLIIIIATAPVVLGGAGSVMGAQHHKILVQQGKTEQLVAKRTQQLSDANLRLVELVQAKDRFVSMVSHELRTPLTAVIGFASKLRELVEGNGEELASIIELEAHAAADIIEDILVAARADIGEVAVHPGRVDLAALANECTKVFAATCDGSAVTADLDRSLAHADPVRVRQILRNLLTNAARYGGPNVVVATGSSPIGACLCVADDGPGVPADVVGHLFEPYGHDAGSQANDSVGLGLHVSRTLARLMGGDLMYQRVSGKTCFSLTLPAFDEQVAPTALAISSTR